MQVRRHADSFNGSGITAAWRMDGRYLKQFLENPPNAHLALGLRISRQDGKNERALCQFHEFGKYFLIFAERTFGLLTVDLEVDNGGKGIVDAVLRLAEVPTLIVLLDLV